MKLIIIYFKSVTMEKLLGQLDQAISVSEQIAVKRQIVKLKAEHRDSVQMSPTSQKIVCARLKSR